jgi:hypothetical protein
MLPVLKHSGFSYVIHKNVNICLLYRLSQISGPIWVIPAVQET